MIVSPVKLEFDNSEQYARGEQYQAEGDDA
jgi:hypothetical protein